MIFNQFLPDEELKESFEDSEWDLLDNILDNFSDLLEQPKTNHITKNSALLGKIHHAANSEKYSKKDFRINIFQKLPPTEQERFFKYCGINKKISTMTFDEHIDCVNSVMGFTWGNNDETKNFIKFNNFPEYLIPDDTPEIKTCETIFGGKKNYQEEKFKELRMLFGYQSSIVYRTLQQLENPNSHCLIQMPTGTGKTRVGMEILSYIFNQTPEVRIVWLTSKHELLEQAHDAFIETWNHVGKFPIELVNLWVASSNEYTKLKIPKSKVLVFAPYQKLNNFLEKGIDLKADYIIVDEAHQILAPEYNKAKDRISSASDNETRLIGLTATPGRGIDNAQNIRLAAEFHSKLIPIELYGDDAKIYKGKPVQYLEDRNILSKTNPIKLPTDYELDLDDNTWKSLAESSIKTGTGDKHEWKQNLFKKMANDNVRNILIIRKLKDLADAGKKILYFSTNMKQSLFVSVVLQQIGVNAVHVQHGIDPSFRRQMIKKFRDTNEISVICNFNIFSTGFDVPDLDTVFIARPVNSPVLFNQMVGRGTRGLMMHGTDTHDLIQVIDKIPPRFASFNPYEQFDFFTGAWSTSYD